MPRSRGVWPKPSPRPHLCADPCPLSDAFSLSPPHGRECHWQLLRPLRLGDQPSSLRHRWAGAGGGQGEADRPWLQGLGSPEHRGLEQSSGRGSGAPGRAGPWRHQQRCVRPEGGDPRGQRVPTAEPVATAKCTTRRCLEDIPWCPPVTPTQRRRHPGPPLAVSPSQRQPRTRHRHHRLR